jgi:hypothetical protein
MARGLQVWDANGNFIFDTNSMSGLILGSIQIAADSGGGNVTLPVAGMGTPFFSCPNTIDVPTQFGTLNISSLFSLSGTTLHYAFPFSASNLSLTVYYGVY